MSCNVTEETTNLPYFYHLSRGGLTILSTSLAELVNKAFALLDFYYEFIQKQCFLPARNGAICKLHQYLLHFSFLCTDHFTLGINFILKTIVNVFHNKQRIANDSVVKDTIAGFKKKTEGEIV